MKYFILSCFKHGYTVRYSTLYHLLTGKKTASVLVYGYFYAVLDYFKLFPKLDESQFNQYIMELSRNQLLQLNEQHVTITPKGLDLLTSSGYKQLELSHLSSLTYHRLDNRFWQRLVLTTQVYSEQAYGHTMYLPVETSPFRLVVFKKWYQSQNKMTAIAFRDELVSLMSTIGELESYILVSQFSGHKHTGQTMTQLASELETTQLAVYLEFKNRLHQLLTLIIKNQINFPVLTNILTDEASYLPVDTVDKTAEIYQRTQSLSDIAKIRGLRESTISDHLIELAISSNQESDILKIYPFGHLDELNHFSKETVVDCRNWDYQQLRQKINGLSFNEFRLYQIKQIKEGKYGE